MNNSANASNPPAPVVQPLPTSRAQSLESSSYSPEDFVVVGGRLVLSTSGIAKSGERVDKDLSSARQLELSLATPLEFLFFQRVCLLSRNLASQDIISEDIQPGTHQVFLIT